MIKNIVAVAVVVALSACSSSGSDSNNSGGSTNPGANPGTNPGTNPGPAPLPNNGNLVVAPPGGGDGPVTASKAGSYTGNFGGANGVFVINNEFEIAGLAMNADGSAQSLFGNLGPDGTFTGDLRQYIHQESRPTAADGGFGSVGNAATPLSIDVNIVNGQTIDSTAASPTAVALVGTQGSAVTPATVEALAGDWSAVHSYCDSDAAGQPIDCKLLATQLNFNGTLVTGETTIDGQGGVLVNGAFTPFGDAALVSFNWGDTLGYEGVIFFTPEADGRIVFIGENASADAKTISAVLVKQ